MIGYKFGQKSKAEKRAFIIGNPIEHSLSPKIHGFWLNRYGVDGSYEAFNVPPPYLAKTVRKLAEDGYVGGNVTIPHKEKVLLLCDELSDAAQKIGAVNTLKFENGRILGDNSDWIGFLDNVFENVSRETFSMKGKTALVLGAGGASRAIIYALQEQGIKVAIFNRSRDRAENLAKQFGCEVVDWAARSKLAEFDILVNTTSLGMVGQPELEIDLSSLPKTAIVNDIVYKPLETALLRQARELGLRAVDGLGMLLHQAVPGFEQWFGVKPQVDAGLRIYIEKCLAGEGAKWTLKEEL